MAVLWALVPQAIHAAHVVDIRAEQFDGRSQVVVELDEPTEYELSGRAVSKLTIRADRPPGERLNAKRLGIQTEQISSINRVYFKKGHAELWFSLKGNILDLELEDTFLENPPRIVVDIGTKKAIAALRRERGVRAEIRSAAVAAESGPSAPPGSTGWPTLFGYAVAAMVGAAFAFGVLYFSRRTPPAPSSDSAQSIPRDPARTRSWELLLHGFPPVVLPAEGSIVIGRHQSCDLAIRSSKASRRHAEIAKSGDGYRLYDLASTNGTFVNGERVEERLLQQGDRIEIGDAIITFGEANRGIEAEQCARPDEPGVVQADDPAGVEGVQSDFSESGDSIDEGKCLESPPGSPVPPRKPSRDGRRPWRPIAAATLLTLGALVFLPGFVVSRNLESQPDHAPSTLGERAEFYLRAAAGAIGIPMGHGSAAQDCLGGGEQVLDSCSAALRVEPRRSHRAQVYASMGLARIKAGEHQLAVDACRRAHDLEPEWPGSSGCMAAALFASCMNTRRYEDRARCEEARTLADDDADRAEILFRLGGLAGAARHFDESLAHCEEAASLAPREPRYRECVTRGRRAVELAREEAALKAKIAERERRLAAAPEGCRDCFEYDSCDDWSSRPARRLLGFNHAMQKFNECVALALSICPRYGIECTKRCGIIKKPGCP
jgi:tetratricopeptide (TPR) repeat protein